MFNGRRDKESRSLGPLPLSQFRFSAVPAAVWKEHNPNVKALAHESGPVRVIPSHSNQREPPTLLKIVNHPDHSPSTILNFHHVKRGKPFLPPSLPMKVKMKGNEGE